MVAARDTTDGIFYGFMSFFIGIQMYHLYLVDGIPPDLPVDCKLVLYCLFAVILFMVLAAIARVLNPYLSRFLPPKNQHLTVVYTGWDLLSNTHDSEEGSEAVDISPLSAMLHDGSQ